MKKRNNIVKVILFIALFGSLFTIVMACFDKQEFSIEALIIEQAKKFEQDSAERFIDFAKVLPFQWDKMFQFVEGATAENIKDLTRVEYLRNTSEVPENYNRLIFVRGNEVVYEEDIANDWPLSKRPYSVEDVLMPLDTTSRLTDSSDFIQVGGGYQENITDELGCYTEILPECTVDKSIYMIYLSKSNTERSYYKGQKLIHLTWAGDSARCAVFW